MAIHHLASTDNAWLQYVENGRLDLELVRPVVASSWERCRKLKVDPFQHIPNAINQLELKERLFAQQRLVRIARPFMENLYNFVQGTGFQVILTDATGFVLEVLGDREIVSRAERVHLCPGGNWSEGAKGTNAIGTALVEQKPVQVYAWEHFCEPHHFLTCSAAPIFDPDGQMIGALDISGDYLFANAHTLGMVVAAVNAIENQLRLQKATEKLYVAYRYSNVLLESMSDGLVSVDNNGVITSINARGAAIFGVNASSAKGRHVSYIFQDPNVRPPILDTLISGVCYEDKEVTLARQNRKIHTSASLLHDDAGAVIGAVAVFREVGDKTIARRLPAVAQRYTFDDIIGSSPVMSNLKAWAKQAAANPSTVLIKGESGTGKEMFAQAIHNASARRDRPFVAINCAALPENLIESELFGYEEGSFTGAKKGGQKGKFELADGGTLFLDEIGDMSLNVQAKLLRVIQEKKVARIGAAAEKPVDLRIIAATHRDLRSDVQTGHFRQDLYYRLHVLEVRIPSLRERADDIPELARHMIARTAARFGQPVPEIRPDFLARLQAHTWPGNIRELENAIERAVIRASETGILISEYVDLPIDVPLTIATDALPKLATAAPLEVKSLRDVERDMIVQALTVFDGNIHKAAAKLGIGRNTLYRKIKEYGIG